MKRTAKSGLIPVTNLSSDSVKTRSAFNRLAPQTSASDWFRIVNSADGEDTTKVYIYDEIGFWGTSARNFLKQLLDIDSSKIELHLNTPGGDVFDGIAIYNTLKQHPAEVTVVVDALAASAGSFIAQAGDRVVMTRNATMMIHDASAFAYGDAALFEEMLGVLNKLSDNIADIYAFNAGGTVAEWRGLMKAETWFNASEAVEAGLANEMLDVEDASAEDAKNKWDLSIFNHAGREDAPAPSEVRRQVLTGITNLGKEAPMARSTVKNNDPEPGTQAPASDPATDPAAPPAAPTDPAEPDEPEGDPAPSQGGDPASTPPAQPSNKAGGVQFSINGSLSTDAVAVQNHINGLEQFRKETLENARKTFVENLATDKKIAATQIDDLVEFALELSDKQYEKWCASWNAAIPSSMLAQHGGTGDPTTGDPSSTDTKAAEIETQEQIVRQHKLSGMKPEVIKNTESYKKLKALKPDFEL